MGNPLIWQSGIQQTFIYWTSPLNKAYRVPYFLKKIFLSKSEKFSASYVQRFTAANFQFHQQSPSLPPQRTDGSPPALSPGGADIAHIWMFVSVGNRDENSILISQPATMTFFTALVFQGFKVNSSLREQMRASKLKTAPPRSLAVAGFLSL